MKKKIERYLFFKNLGFNKNATDSEKDNLIEKIINEKGELSFLQFVHEKGLAISKDTLRRTVIDYVGDTRWNKLGRNKINPLLRFLNLLKVEIDFIPKPDLNPTLTKKQQLNDLCQKIVIRFESFLLSEKRIYKSLYQWATINNMKSIYKVFREILAYEKGLYASFFAKLDKVIERSNNILMQQSYVKNRRIMQGDEWKNFPSNVKTDLCKRMTENHNNFYQRFFSSLALNQQFKKSEPIIAKQHNEIEPLENTNTPMLLSFFDSPTVQTSNIPENGYKTPLPWSFLNSPSHAIVDKKDLKSPYLTSPLLFDQKLLLENESDLYCFDSSNNVDGEPLSPVVDDRGIPRKKQF